MAEGVDDFTRDQAIAILCSVVERYARLSGDEGDADAVRMAKAVLLAPRDAFLGRRVEELARENEQLRARLDLKREDAS